jgi:hypothetical protein
MNDQSRMTPEPETEAERIYRETGGPTPLLRKLWAMFRVPRACPHCGLMDYERADVGCVGECQP